MSRKQLRVPTRHLFSVEAVPIVSVRSVVGLSGTRYSTPMEPMSKRTGLKSQTCLVKTEGSLLPSRTHPIWPEGVPWASYRDYELLIAEGVFP